MRTTPSEHPQTDPNPRYHLRGDLVAGDIVLSTMRSSAVSAVIRSVTRSGFSHVAIYRGESNILEAVNFGVINYSVSRRGFAERRNVKVLRLGLALARREEFIAAAVEAAENYRGRGYWTTGAALSVFGNKLSDRVGRMFCSYFVAQVYSDAGLSLVPGKAPTEVTPEDINRSPLLVDVSQSVVQEVPAWQLQLEGRGAQDFQYLATPHAKNQSFERSLLAMALPTLAKFGLPTPNRLTELFDTLVLLEDRQMQVELDKQLAPIFEVQDFLYATHLDQSTEDDPGFITALSDAPLRAVEDTLGLHLQTREKWLVRQADYEAEIVAGQEIQRRFQLRATACLLLRTITMLEILEGALEMLDRTIEQVRTVLQAKCSAA